MIVLSHPTWVRGLKHLIRHLIRQKPDVAPYVGAWIETEKCSIFAASIRSHPTWVRGLKLECECRLSACLQSHPTWVRGLKPRYRANTHDGCGVAPYVGAWIETYPARIRMLTYHVAPYVGAWIETPGCSPTQEAWKSHPTWVRGLKLYDTPII